MKTFNEKIWLGAESGFRFRESKDPTTGQKKFILRGLLLPFNQISRNGVLYNTASIKEKYKTLLGVCFCYNHQIDGANDKSYGHVIESLLIESDANVPQGWEDIYTKPGWYYAVDIDPEEKDLIRKFTRGDLRHVSIQLVGESVEEKFDKDNNEYTEAWIGDVIEMSGVIAPGFLDTTAAMIAEKLGVRKKEAKEDVNTGNASGAMVPKMADQTNEKEIVTPLPEDQADPKELEMGVKVEMEHTDNPEEAKKIALQHLAEKPNYYTLLKQVEQERVGADPTQPLMECDEEEIKEFMKLGEEKLKEILETGN